jgi:hypothetical protein
LAQPAGVALSTVADFERRDAPPLWERVHSTDDGKKFHRVTIDAGDIGQVTTITERIRKRHNLLPLSPKSSRGQRAERGVGLSLFCNEMARGYDYGYDGSALTFLTVM